MSRRTILIFTLSTLVLLGLVAGLFTGSMEMALGAPQGPQMMANMQGMPQTQGNRQANTPGATPQGTAPIKNNQQNQQMNILATDTFQRQDQALWGIASDGRQWGGDANAKDFFTIKGGKGQIAGGQGALEAVIGLPTDNVDVTISGTVNQFGNNVNLGTVLRWRDTNNWYKAFIGGNQLSILKSVNGKPTIIVQTNVKTDPGVAQTLRFRVFGTTLFAKVWPSATTEPQKWMLVADDHTFATGQFGIRVFEQPTTVITITSFNAATAAMGNTI